MSTNPVEAYHSALKYGNKVIMQRFSLLGIVKHVLGVDRRYLLRAEETRINFRGKTLAEEALVPGIVQFPLPVQNLLSPEIREGKKLCDDGEVPRTDVLQDIRPSQNEESDNDELFDWDWSIGSCDCRFYRKWRLPCRHLFHLHFVTDGQTLTTSRLQQWSLYWEDYGFELYEVNKQYTAFNPVLREEGAISPQDRVAAREVTETLLSSFYELEQAAHRQLGQEGRSFIEWWIGKLRAAATQLKDLKFDDWKAELPEV